MPWDDTVFSCDHFDVDQLVNVMQMLSKEKPFVVSPFS